MAAATAVATRAGRRQAILDAALRLFAEHGVHGTSIEDILAASGASNGSVYHHFGSKEGVAAALYADAIEHYQRGAQQAIIRADTAEAGLTACVRHYLRWVRDHRDLAVLMLAVERADFRDLAAGRVDALNEAFRSAVGEWLAARAQAGDLPDLPADLLLPVLLGPAKRFAELWLAGRTTTSITKAADVLADVAWRGLGGRAAL